MVYYFMANDGTHVDGYTLHPNPENDVNYCAIENPSRELLDNYIFYKIVDDELVKIAQHEFDATYPDYNKATPTTEELLGQRITDLELMLLENELNKTVNPLEEK